MYVSAYLCECGRASVCIESADGVFVRLCPSSRAEEVLHFKEAFLLQVAWLVPFFSC